MTENPILIETSFADAVAIIAVAPELSEQTRRHWPTSMRQDRSSLGQAAGAYSGWLGRRVFPSTARP